MSRPVLVFIHAPWETPGLIDTALAGIQRLVEEAQTSRSRAQALADRAAAFLFYVATGSALVTFVVWMLLGDTNMAVEATVTVLVIACPHALGLAIPLVIAISTAQAARAGILVTDRLALERMRSIDAVLFDKTGTLTSGQHAVTGVAAAGGSPPWRARTAPSGCAAPSPTWRGSVPSRPWPISSSAASTTSAATG